MRLLLTKFFVIVAAIGIGSASGAGPNELEYVPNSTKKVCQLTGDFDRSAKIPTLSLTGKRFGVEATDLGSSFEHQGNLYFLFGDTVGRPGARDAVAWTTSVKPDKIVLDFFKEKDGKWLPPTVPGISLGPFEIPSCGVSVAGAIYVAFTTDHSAAKVMGRSVLAISHDDGRTWRMLYEFSRTKFINVSFLLTDGWLFIFGSGDYRKSTVCLARVKPKEIEERAKLVYLAGIEPNGQPTWSTKEADATPLSPNDQICEFSVDYLEPVKRYVMLYNSGKRRGIVMRSAEMPRGPWSAGTVIFDPGRDNGHGHFMRISTKTKPSGDGLSDPRREAEWGGEYGPYVISRFTSGSEGRCRIYYTIAAWNPYQVVVMQTVLRLGDRD